MFLILLLCMVQVEAVDPVPYTLFLLKGNSASQSGVQRSCRHLFSGVRGQYIEFEAPTGSSHELIVELGTHSPVFNASRELRVSRSFKMKSRDGYSGYWARVAKRYPLVNEVPGKKMQDYTNHFLDRWVSDFGRSVEGVNKLRAISHESDPLRKIQFGVKMGEIPWGSVVLFDGSSKLRTFDVQGHLNIEKAVISARSDLEIRYPQLKLPERVRQSKGEDVNVFFLGLLSSLKEVDAVIPDVYHRVALMMLMKISPELLVEGVVENTRQNDPEVQQSLRMDAFRRIDSPAPYHLGQNAPRTVRVSPDNMGQALLNARGVRMYGAAHESLLNLYLKQGWKVIETNSSDNVNSDIKIIYYDVYEFALKYFKTDEFNSNFANATEEGQRTQEYQETQKRSDEHWKQILERIKRLEAARGTL